MTDTPELDFADELKLLAVKSRAQRKPIYEYSILFRKSADIYFRHYELNSDEKPFVAEAFGLYTESGDPIRARKCLEIINSQKAEEKFKPLVQANKKYSVLYGKYLKQLEATKPFIANDGPGLDSFPEKTIRQFIREVPGLYWNYWILFRIKDERKEFSAAKEALDVAAEFEPQMATLWALKIFVLTYMGQVKGEVDDIYSNFGEGSIDVSAAYFCALTIRLNHEHSPDLISSIVRIHKYLSSSVQKSPNMLNQSMVRMLKYYDDNIRHIVESRSTNILVTKEINMFSFIEEMKKGMVPESAAA